MNNETILSKRLKELRVEHNKSQKEVLADLKLKQTALSNYENGTREPTFETLNKFARYYNVTVDYLTGNSEFKNVLHEKLHEQNVFFRPETVKQLASFTKNELDILEILVLSPLSEFKFLLNVFLSYYNGIPESKINLYIGALAPGGAGAPMTMDLMKYEKQMAQIAIANASEYILKYLDSLRPEGGKREWQTVTVVKEGPKKGSE